MPRRPLPVLPRLARLRKRERATDIILGCPRISPQWELHAIQALIKPQLRGRIEHKNGDQPWPRDGSKLTARVWDSFAASASLHDFDSPLHLLAAGEYHAVATFSTRDEPIARAFAVALSRATPSLWWIVGRLFVRDGTFFRRKRGVELQLVRANDVHLPRELRAAVRRITSSPSPPSPRVSARPR